MNKRLYDFNSHLEFVFNLPVSGVFTAGVEGEEPTGIYWKDSVCFNGVVEGVEVTKPVSEKNNFF